MIQWKQRLYAFLLRRILEPILERRSLQQLHQSIEVSIQEGCFALTDVELNLETLQQKLSTTTLRIRRVHIQRLEIHLQLVEHEYEAADTSPTTGPASDSSGRPGTSSSFVWKAMQLTSNRNLISDSTAGASSSTATETAASSVYLLARVEIDGVLIEIGPTTTVPPPGKANPEPVSPPASTNDATPSKSSSNLLSSYIEAALSSLRLTLTMNNLKVRVLGREETTSDPVEESKQQPPGFLELRLSSVAYDTVPIPASGTTTRDAQRMMVHKTLTVQTLSLHVGTTEDVDSSSTTIALLQGPSQICLRAFEYGDDDVINKQEESPKRVQQDIEVSIQQRLNVSVDEASLRQLVSITQDYRSVPAPSAVERIESLTLEDEEADAVGGEEAGTGVSAQDERDLDALGDIMKQYQEARRLVERQEIRGGLLLPSDDVVEDGEVTFDAFFDANEFFEANEYSIHRYSTSLRQSIMQSASLDNGRVVDFVHTKLRFHLKEAGIKVSFPMENLQTRPPAPVEYVMAIINDVNVSSSLSLQTSEHAISATHLDVEVSRLDQTYGQGTGHRRIEIETILSFTPVSCTEDEALGGDDILLETPSISVHSKTDNNGAAPSTEIEVSLSPCEFTFDQATVASFADLARSISRDDRVVEKPSGDLATTEKRVCVQASCASITVGLPLAREDDWSALYDRCGYQKRGTTMTKSRIGLVFDQMSLQLNDNASVNETLSVTCYQVLAFAASPFGRHAMERRVQRFDFFQLSGLTAVNPVIPVSLSLFRQTVGVGGEEGENHGRKAFPVVPALSSFKARQEDEDEENRIDRVLHSRLPGVSTDIRKGLQANHPQQDMLSAASTSKMTVSINAPEILCDLTTHEITLLNRMMASLIDPDLKRETADSRGGGSDSASATCSSFSFACDYLSLALHGEVPTLLKSADRSYSHSFVVRADQIKTHLLSDRGGIRHARFLAHEIDFYEVTNLATSETNRERPERLSGGDDIRMRTCMTITESCSVVPIVYRSHLFEPISRESPSVLLDWLRVAKGDGDADQTMSQMNVHITLYDLTYRYNFDSDWIEHLRSSIREIDLPDKGNSEPPPRPKSLTRVFFSVADCNVDYSSSPGFQTASRTILRIGDFRVSSNVVLPALPVQAFTVACGDATVYLCPDRFPYNFENRGLLGLPSPMRPEETTLDSLRLSSDATAEEVFRAMNYRTIVMLDSMDAIVALSTTDSQDPDTPRARVSLTLGELALFACKDSFACFTNTVGELQTRLAAVDDAGIAALKACSAHGADSVAVPASRNEGAIRDESVYMDASERLAERSALPPETSSPGMSTQFLLDGYDWTTIDADESNACRIPAGEEQQSRWYAASPTLSDSGLGREDAEEFEQEATFEPRIITHHFHLHPTSDPFGEGDMDSAKYAGTVSSPKVQNRILVHDLGLKCRLFDGYDWPELLDARTREYSGRRAFVIDDEAGREIDRKMKEEVAQNIDDNIKNEEQKEALKRKAELMGNLLDDTGDKTTFGSAPLPEERGQKLKEQADLRRLARRTSKFVQISALGVRLRLDTYMESRDHQLASCMNVLVQDFFLSETISSDTPVKMIGEWVNETEHPRESKDGMIMMQMVTWHPNVRVTEDGDIANDECVAAVKILPLRSMLDQRATRFTRRFFHGEESQEEEGQSLPEGLHAVPPPLFQTFSVQSLKMKIDYTPEKVDARALRDGAVVELINLSPLDALVLTLLPVEVDNVIGFGDVVGIVIRRWIEHICSTQMYKFVANTRALEPFTHVGGSAVDMIVLPWDALKNGESVARAIRSGVKSFAKALTYETLTTTSRVAGFAAHGAAKVSGLNPGGSSTLPARPIATPRSALEATPHGLESIARGLQTANYRIVIIPYREYQRTGTKGAVTSVLKGIPVAIAAPAGGAVEALSYALIGTRNYLQPEIRKEEEARSRGLLNDR